VVEGVPDRRVGPRDAELTRDVVDPAEHDPEVALGRHPGVLDRLGERLDRDPGEHGGVRRAGQLGVPNLLHLRHLASDLEGEQAYVLGRADQVDDSEVDLDEVGEVAEGEELGQGLGVAGHDTRVAGCQLGDDTR
jgi:hypothetical protein